MTPDRTKSYSAGDCTENAPEQHTTPRISISSDHNMLAYSQYSSPDQHFFPPSSVAQTFTSEDDFFNVTSQSAALAPSSHQQYAYHPQHYFQYRCPSLPYLPRNRPSLQLNPFTSTMDPHMMMNQSYTNYAQSPVQLSGYHGPASCSTEPARPVAVSPQIPFSTGTDTVYTAPLWQQNLPDFGSADFEPSTASTDDGIERIDDEEDSIYDKPYAQLIFEALMQAPGNRMLLRDIYEWFIRNTRKPQESGTNGWQNSIRHNLSMNQAFENDKNDPAANRGARKANSMWVLTEYAKQYGVQSTTRYRKNGTSKKASANRVPAVQRQRSGAKGGRAARRAARLKRQEEGHRRNFTTQPEAEGQSPYQSPLSATQDHWSTYSYSPTTPSEDQFIRAAYSLPHRSHYEYHRDRDMKFESEVCPEDEQLRQMLSQSEELLGHGDQL